VLHSTSRYQITVNAMLSLVQDLEFPDRLLGADAVKAEGDFDVNKYFSVLKHISLEPGYILDYTFMPYLGDLGSCPLIYAREKDKPSHLNIPDENKETGQLLFNDFVKYIRTAYMRYIHTDGTEEGFFQFIVLRVMGGQFYLVWHANYLDTRIVCDQAGLNSVLDSIPEFYEYHTQIVKMQAKELNLEPKIEFRNDIVLVSVVTFTKWGGLEQTTYQINRTFPHKVLREGTKTLVEYYCGVKF